MIEVYKNLYVGNQFDEETLQSREDWFIVHACKEPYHRQTLGYSGRGAPKDHPEYLFAVRDGRLILNLVDVPNPKYIAMEIMEAAVKAIHEDISSKKVLVHCNQGMSRSPSIAFLYLAKHTGLFEGLSLEAALHEFKELYPSYAPAGGVAGFIRENWGHFSS